MITKIVIGKQRINLDNHKSITREQQVEEIKNFLCRPKLFEATHAR